MVGVHAASVVDRGFESRWCETKDYTIIIVAYLLSIHIRSESG